MSVVLHLPCSTIQALHAIGLLVDELHARMPNLSSLVANTLIGPVIRDLCNSVSDLSCHVAPLELGPTPSLSAPPPPTHTAPGRPNILCGPRRRAVSRKIPSHPVAPAPIRSDADVIHGGTSEFDQAVAENAAARRSKGKGKKSPTATTTSKVVTAVEAASLKGPFPLISAVRRSFTPRNLPAPHSEHDLIRIRWPYQATWVSREVNSGIPVSFKVMVNDNGAVSLTGINTTVPAAFYSWIFHALTLQLNQLWPVGNIPWLPFCLAPTVSQFAINALPIKPTRTMTTTCVIPFSPLSTTLDLSSS